MFLVYLKSLGKLIRAYLSGRYFWNYKFYKKYPNDENQHVNLRMEVKINFAIVMQGPLILDSNFTVETLKMYRCNCPDAILILSTWRVPDDVIKILKKYRIHIIKNRQPEIPGISNINLQIVTSGAGVLDAKNLGAQFVLKTRTDQRAYHPNLEAYLFSLVKAFPLSHNFPNQIDRLVAISLGTLKHRLYGISDMFLYGHIDDMIRYWNIPLCTRTKFFDELQNTTRTERDSPENQVPEVYLCTEYLKSIEREAKFTLEDSYSAFGEHFVIIDQSALKLYWHKYTLNEDRYAKFGFFDPELCFNDWLILYKSMKTISIGDCVLNKAS